MAESKEVVVLSEHEKVEEQKRTSFPWRGSYKQDRELVFRRAYEIATNRLQIHLKIAGIGSMIGHFMICLS